MLNLKELSKSIEAFKSKTIIKTTESNDFKFSTSCNVILLCSFLPFKHCAVNLPLSTLVFSSQIVQDRPAMARLGLLHLSTEFYRQNDPKTSGKLFFVRRQNGRWGNLRVLSTHCQVKYFPFIQPFDNSILYSIFYSFKWFNEFSSLILVPEF